MNNLMNFDEFVDVIAGSVKDHLPPEYADAEVNISESHKINSSYLGMTVAKEGQDLRPTVNLDAMFLRYQQDGDLGDVFGRIAEIVGAEPLDISLGKLEDYEQAKDSLFIRVCNMETNRDLLDTVPHETVGDLAVTYHILVDRDENGLGSTIVSNVMMEKFGITEEQLRADAMENSGKILSPALEPMNRIMMRMMGFEDPVPSGVPFETAVADFDFSQDSMFVLTNTSAVNGASVMFYPEVMEQLGERAGGDLFVIPSSVHEVLLVPDDGMMNRTDLEKIIRDINANEVDPKDRLSDSLYHYDSREHKLERAVDFEERTQVKEKVSIKDKLKDAGEREQSQTSVNHTQKEQTLE